MQFLLLAHDGSDGQALARRMAARPAHLERAERLRREGVLLYAVAILDDAGRMVGTVMVFEVLDRGSVDVLLEEEPYVTGDVWRTVEISPCRVPDHFLPGR